MLMGKIKKPADEKPKTRLIRLRLGQSELEALGKFATDFDVNQDAPIRDAEAIKRILKDFLIAAGYLDAH